MEKIDILIPIYNCEKYISKCLDSILNQTYKDINIIIADDGSTDKSAKIIDDYAKKYSNIVVFNKINENSISKTRNFLLEKVTSNYFTFVDADDYIEPNYIETLCGQMFIDSNVDMSMCGKIRHKENKKIVIESLYANSKQIFMHREEALAEMLSSNLYNGTVYCKLFKTELCKGIKFDENIYYGEDLDFCYKVMKRCNYFAFNTNKLYHYIIRKGSYVVSRFNTSKLTCLTCYENIIKDLEQSNNTTLLEAAKSMQGLIAIELLYYTFRDKFKDKAIKQNLKSIIKSSIPYIKKNKRLSKLNQKAPLVWWITKFM